MKLLIHLQTLLCFLLFTNNIFIFVFQESWLCDSLSVCCDSQLEFISMNYFTLTENVHQVNLKCSDYQTLSLKDI